jgi:Holliday junction resolvase RusA-like endonuclease
MERYLHLKLDIEPFTWGSEKDPARRVEIRDAIKKEIPDFNEEFVCNFINERKEISVTINCFLKSPEKKDIDNLLKIPIDAIFYAGKGERGYKLWESKITSVTINKYKGDTNSLEIIIYRTRS